MLEKPAFFPCRDVGRGSVPEADMGRCGQSEISGRCPHVRWQPCFGRVAGKGAITFRIDLPGRGHAAAAHPNRPEAIAFARRPGTFAIILDCLSGKPVNLVEAPPNRHFCRHGAYSADGELLFTTENDFSQSLGVVGVWDASKGYVRIGEMSSGGVGPHDMHLMADGQTLVVANGGIETHPDSGRTKLNLQTMRPNLS